MATNGNMMKKCRGGDLLNHTVNSYLMTEPYLIQFPLVRDMRGGLTFIESFSHVPFPIRRLYYLFDVPQGATRGGHAHRTLQQCLIAVTGSFDVVVDDGLGITRFTLNDPTMGLMLPPMVWRELEHFLPNTVCLALASDLYDEHDYIRTRDEFLTLLGAVSS
jgi:dTDP-4-dehydrorhamnose 3,5-epimerase-like enzyme